MEKRVAIIGAGVSGLAACKYCLQKGFNPIVLEADERIGGVWNHTIESTRLQNTKDIYQFSDFPWSLTVKDLHPTHDQVMDYLNSYATNFSLFPCIKFNRRVIGIDYVGQSYEQIESWDLWSGTGKPFGSNGKWHIKAQDTRNSAIEDYEVEFVILCVGQFSGYPNIPEFGENEGPQVFNGEVMHSMEFSASKNKGVSNFVHCKRVAIIGSHKSAVDIAALCANINGKKKACTIVQRNANWFFGSGFVFGLWLSFMFLCRFSELMVHKPGETIFHSILATFLSPLRWGSSKLMEWYLRWKFPMKKYGMVPKYNITKTLSSCYMALLPEGFYDKVEEGSIVIKNSQSFKFYKDGLILNIDGKNQHLETDVVIFATGFKGDVKIKIMFSSSVFQDWIMATSPLLLYRQILHPRIPQLAIIGHNEIFSNLGNSELKSLWVANFLDGKFELPCIRDMEKEAKLWADHIKKNAGRYHRRGCISTDIWYNDKLCKDMGYSPRMKKGFFTDLFVPYVPPDYASITTN